MKASPRLMFSVIVSLMFILALSACASGNSDTNTSTGLTPVGAGGGNGAGGGSGGSGGGAGSGGGNNGNGAATPAPNPTVDPNLIGGPYVVHQTQKLGDESISGQLCRSDQPFTVTSTTSRITFNFNFVPGAPNQGTWTDAYSFPDLGETHNAQGTYTLSAPEADGTIHLTMNGSDHVVFNGFDGNVPLSYKFDLVHSDNTGCPQ